MSGKMMQVALEVVRKKFIDVSSRCLTPASHEFNTVATRADLIFKENVLGGKMARSRLCLAGYQALRPDACQQSIEAAAQVASTLEMVQAFYLMADDIMDQSQTRRGKICWYKRPEIGYSAVNDVLMLDSFVHDVLDEIIPNDPNLQLIHKSFRKSKRLTVLGQLLDTSSERNIEAYNWQRYEQIVQFKTSHYSFFHPLEISLLLSDSLTHIPTIQSLMYDIGLLFQSQDDYLDVFGDPHKTGKIGTDLIDGKCTWLVVKALERCDETQRSRLLKALTTGSSSNEALQLLHDLKVQESFRSFESNLTEKISQSIANLPQDISTVSSVVQGLLSKLYKREK